MNEEPRKRALVGECISRASVEAARGATPADVDAALAGCDYERAATIAFARAKAGEPLGADVIGRILPGIELPAVTCSLIAITPDRAALLEVLERQRFPRTKDAGELEAITLYGAWRAGADRTRLIPHLRRLSARPLTAEGYALLATVAASYEDPNVVAATKPIAPFAKEHAKSVATDEKAMTATLDAVIAELPPEVEESAAAGFTVRSTKQVGRNDPCPCGSGLKYKKCCADKQISGKPSPVPGVTWDDFLGAAADKMGPDHVAELTLKDLARIDLTRVSDLVMRRIEDRFLVAHEWDHAERVVAEAERRGYDEEKLVDVRDFYVNRLVDVGLLERAKPYIAKLPAEIAKHYAIDLAVAEGPAAAYEALVAEAREAIASTDKIPSIDLAYSLLRAEPVLGILAARACIGTLQVDDADMLLETVEEVRDDLNLPPTDPAWAVLDELTDDDKDTDSDGDAKLRTALTDSSARVDHLERALAAMRSELDAHRTRPAAELVRAPEVATGLESRVRELEALIREGNAERRDLRKQLEKHAESAIDSRGGRDAAVARDGRDAHDRREGPRARRATLDEVDDDEGDALEPGQREVRIPRFERRFVDALGSVPATVAAEAMRTVGTLAAGDAFAWRGVKQAKDMPRPTFMGRVGIHHRLIMRTDGGHLDVVDLITRETLQTTLKRLRANR